MSNRKINPKLKNMTKEELKVWKEKMKYLEGDNMNKHKTEYIKQGKGWMF